MHSHNQSLLTSMVNKPQWISMCCVVFTLHNTQRERDTRNFVNNSRKVMKIQVVYKCVHMCWETKQKKTFVTTHQLFNTEMVICIPNEGIIKHAIDASDTFFHYININIPFEDAVCVSLYVIEIQLFNWLINTAQLILDLKTFKSDMYTCVWM